MRLKTQVLIVGGGVAGLWLLHTLRRAHISCVLVENQTLGGGQTIHSQGIIHSGLKYALHGKLTASALSMQNMPSLWHQCLQGEGAIDLRTVEILSNYQYLWSPGSMAVNLATFLASKNLKSHVSALARSDYPAVFSVPGFKGVVYRLEEPVLAVRSLIETLAKPFLDYIFHADIDAVVRESSSTLVRLRSQQTLQELDVDQIVLLAGNGNEALSKTCAVVGTPMQRRPLHMVVVNMPHLPTLYAHAMQLSDKPRVTITTHGVGEKTVWYLGGDIAETGMKRSAPEQVAFARQELGELFAHIDFSSADIRSFFIDRAEACHDSGKKPDSPVLHQEKNVMIAWPTKLAFAPVLAQDIANRLVSLLAPHFSFEQDKCLQRAFNPPLVATYEWSETL
ncbi:MAG: FAD-dependent oxidoreductase [Gammaproteobacteria bacterium]|nr:FAD-dependent oxidoreductase [Gammaproteobacteria bacterium]MCD8524731.1 FAD-dependent oxidoreductase [Gammaproteobacteria bacterium]MCD8542858.1 FAD-dependent oxidoreductase [Gammaproteobacteria bacterium]